MTLNNRPLQSLPLRPAENTISADRVAKCKGKSYYKNAKKNKKREAKKTLNGQQGDKERISALSMRGGERTLSMIPLNPDSMNTHMTHNTIQKMRKQKIHIASV